MVRNLTERAEPRVEWRVKECELDGYFHQITKHPVVSAAVDLDEWDPEEIVVFRQPVMPIEEEAKTDDQRRIS